MAAFVPNVNSAHARKWLLLSEMPRFERTVLLAKYETIGAVLHAAGEAGALGERDVAVMDAIEQDVGRTYGVALEPSRSGAATARQHAPAVDRLRRVLVTFSVYDRATGYVQGLNFIAAMLLQHCADEADAFCLLVRLMHARPWQMAPLMAQGMVGLRVVCRVMDKLVALQLPELSEHLARLDVAALHYHEWWFTLFSLVLPPGQCADVWSVLFADGYSPTVYRVTLILLRQLWPRHLRGADAHATLMALKGFARARAAAASGTDGEGAEGGAGPSSSGAGVAIEPPADLIAQLQSRESLAITAGLVANLMREAQAELEAEGHS